MWLFLKFVSIYLSYQEGDCKYFWLDAVNSNFLLEAAVGDPRWILSFNNSTSLVLAYLNLRSKALYFFFNYTYFNPSYLFLFSSSSYLFWYKASLLEWF